MKKNNLIDNICFKFFIFILITNLILEQEYQKIESNNLENYFGQSICQLIYFTLNYNCSLNFITNTNFYNDILVINSNVNLLINIKMTILENIILLLGIAPFLKNNSTLWNALIKYKIIFN